MAHVDVRADDLDLESPTLVEGLPGVGLVGKIAADHLVDEFGMTHYANVHCESLPRAVTYAEEDRGLTTPVRLFADAERDLLVLRGDVPVSPDAAREFATCVSDWFTDRGVTPIYLSGLPAEKDDEPPALHGVGIGEGTAMLADTDIDEPADAGLISGPTGALLAHALEHDVTAVGLVVESDPQFPDPEAARVLIESGIAPLTGIDVPYDALVDRAEEIRDAKQQLARQMQQADEESTRAQPLRMYQ